LVLTKKIAGAARLEQRALFAVVPLFVAGVVSTLVATPYLVSASFVPCWMYFATGVLACWAPTRIPRAFLFGALVVLAALCAHAPSPTFVCAIAAAALLYGGRSGLLRRTGGAVLQWLGRISYSLYLTHMLSTAVALQLLSRVLDPPYSLPELALLMTTSMVAALVCAALFHAVIERPSHALSRKLRLTTAA
jgi:peptidoglycan/LPS O-acetylase OafA/YrhL